MSKYQKFLHIYLKHRIAVIELIYDAKNAADVVNVVINMAVDICFNVSFITSTKEFPFSWLILFQILVNMKVSSEPMPIKY